MATLAGQKIKDKFGNLLHVEGGVTATLKVVEDGDGTDTALSVSTSNVEVEALSFGTQPSLTTGETDALFVQSSGSIVKQALAQSAFTLPSVVAGTDISVSGSFPNFTVNNTNPDQTVVMSAGTAMSVTGTYPNFTVTNTAPDQVVAIAGGQDINVTGTYPNFTVNHTINTLNIINADTNSSPPLSITQNEDSITFAGGTGISTSGDINTKTLTIINDAPDQVVDIDGTGGTTVTGTYPNFVVNSKGVHEEMFVGMPETTYSLGAVQPIGFSPADNTNSAVSFHFGKLPAQLQLSAPTEISNISGVDLIMYIDTTVHLQVNSPNSSATYSLEMHDGTSWNKIQEVTRHKSVAGVQVDSFFGIFVFPTANKLRIMAASTTGGVDLLPVSQFKFEVKETGNII